LVEVCSEVETNSLELKPKAFSPTKGEQDFSMQAATAPLPPSYTDVPPPYAPQAQPQSSSQQDFLDGTPNAQTYGNPPFSSSHPKPHAQYGEIANLIALHKHKQEQQFSDKQVIANMFHLYPRLVSKAMLTQDSVLSELKEKGIEGLNLSNKGRTDNFRLRVAQVEGNKHLMDALSRFAVEDKARNASPFCSTNPLVAYKKAPAKAAKQINIFYDGDVLPYHTFIPTYLKNNFKKYDRKFHCTADEDQAVFLNAVLLQDGREDYKKNQEKQGIAKYKIECAFSNVQSPEYSFGRIALSLNSDGTYSMVKDGFTMMMMDNAKNRREQYFFGKDLHETTGISDSAFLSLTDSKDPLQQELSQRIASDQLLIITFNLIPKAGENNDKFKFPGRYVVSDGGSSDLESDCGSGIASFTTSSNDHTFYSTPSRSLGPGSFDVKDVTMDLVGPVVMNRNFVEKFEEAHVVQIFTINLQTRIQMLENTLGQKSSHEAKEMAQKHKFFPPANNAKSIEHEHYQGDASPNAPVQTQ